MIKKLVLAAAAAAVAISFASTTSFAKKAKAEKACTPGTLTTGKPNSMGWGPVSMCGLDGKWHPTLMSCYVASGLCPK